MNPDPDSASLTLEQGVVRCTDQGREVWSFAVEDLRIVAHMTTDAGPFAADLFYVFVVGEPALTYQVEMGLNLGLQGELAAQHHLDFEWSVGLAGVTDFASLITWPPPLAGQALYDFSPVRHRGLGRVIDWLLPRVRHEFTAEVKAFLRSDGGVAPRPTSA